LQRHSLCITFRVKRLTMSKYVLTGLTQAGSLELEGGFNTIGRNPTNDLRIRDATVSSFHCEIIRKEDSIRVRDLGSTNGTYVDGVKVEESALQPGSVLRVGSIEFKIERREDDAIPPVVIPKLNKQPEQSQVLLPDGHAACLNHNTVYACYECQRCQKTFCQDCVSSLRISGGNTRVFCPVCSGHCESIPVPPGVSTTATPRSDSVLGRLSQTIRIRFK
jgi:hypothetical protein